MAVPIRRGFALIVSLIVCMSVVVSSQAVSADDAMLDGIGFIVDSTTDAVDATPGDGVCESAVGECTLRAAIGEANALPGVDSVALPAGSFVLALAGTGDDASATGDLDITESVAIGGAGAVATIVDGGQLDRVFHVVGAGPVVTISDLTITGGVRGAVWNEGELTIERVIVTDNLASGMGLGVVHNNGGLLNVVDSLLNDNVIAAGAIKSSRGEMNVVRTVIANNSAVISDIGGIDSYGTDTLILDSIITGNGFIEEGSNPDTGGVANRGPGSMAIVGSTISWNSGKIAGGVSNRTDGNSGGTSYGLVVVNSTIAHNEIVGAHSGAQSGGVYVEQGEVEFVNSTVAENVGRISGGISKDLGTLVYTSNTIFANNYGGDGPDCYGTLISLDYNLVEDGTGCSLSGNQLHDLVGVDPMLGDLADNGGLTPTMALLVGSPAIDAGNPATPGSGVGACEVTDQRGEDRPMGPRCDIGAFEAAAPSSSPPPPPPPSNTFIDDDGHTFETDIEWMAGEGITKGCNPPVNDRFCPDSVVTRGQMAAFLVRALGLADRLDNPFTDDDDSIFEADIERLAAAGITKGCNPSDGNTKFCPDGKVTRQQMAAFLKRAFDYPTSSIDFFADDDTSIFESDINAIAMAGVTKGCNPPTNNLYCPTGLVTRGQMAAFLHRALG